MARAMKLAVAPLVLWVSAAWLAVFVGIHFWPTSYWFEPRRVQVHDAEAGQPITMHVVRTIHRPFHADWHVRVWQATHGGWEVVCAGTGGGSYRPDAVIPGTITLHRWSGGNCETLPPGSYQISTTWLIHRSVLPGALVSIESNVFTAH